MAGASVGAGTTYHSRAHELTTVF